MIRELSEKNQEIPVDIIIALGNGETELAVDYLIGEGEERKESCLLYGVGCSEKAVYYLDKGWIKSLVVPNEFNMGYLSMEEVARQLKYRLSRAESMEVDYLVIDQTNLYKEDNQKSCFQLFSRKPQCSGREEIRYGKREGFYRNRYVMCSHDAVCRMWQAGKDDKVESIRIGVTVYDQYDTFVSQLMESFKVYARQKTGRPV